MKTVFTEITNHTGCRPDGWDGVVSAFVTIRRTDGTSFAYRDAGQAHEIERNAREFIEQTEMDNAHLIRISMN